MRPSLLPGRSLYTPALPCAEKIPKRSRTYPPSMGRYMNRPPSRIRQELPIVPNSKAMKEILKVEHMPRDFRFQSEEFGTPRSQIH